MIVFHLYSLVLTLLLIDDVESSSIAMTDAGPIIPINHQQQRWNLEQQQDVIDYKIWEASKIPDVLKEWQNKYPHLIQVTTAQEAYGLPMAGTKKDCPFYEESDGCPNYFFTLQDYTTHPQDSISSSYLPEVFISGCLHGNERVGPTSVMEATALLLEATHCEGLPRRSSSSSLDSELKKAKTCRQVLKRKGIDDIHRKWLARLVTTRRIVVAPTTNALGYYRNARTEGNIDPNRDFPYDLTDSSMCMQTIAGRTANEIYREHMFQLALTFHGGMEVIAYEWGAPSWLTHLSPDDEAQSAIGGAYSLYGAGWSKSKPYKFGTMNDLVYPVRGGMEDWAYAGSWTPDKVIQCTPKQFGGYPKEKTTYNNSTLRVFNMLVEASNTKEPRTNLGNSVDVLNRDTTGNGHISRNIRLSLLAVDMVEPYVSVVGVNKLALTDDIVPMTKRESNSCMDTKVVMVAKNSNTVDIEWSVGGAMAIDSTELWYAKWDDVAEEVECWTQPSNTDNFQRVGGATNGTGFFSVQGSYPRPEESVTGVRMTNGPLFSASIPLRNMKEGDKIMVIASARVDQSWKNQPSNVLPNMPPQSHVVNARTDPNYHHESNGKHIQGRIDWFSVPLTVVLGDFDDSVGTRNEDSVNTVELYPRFSESSINKGGVKPKPAKVDQLWFPIAFWQYLIVALLIVVFSICCIKCFCFSSSDGRIKLKQGDSFDESDAFDFEPEPYFDRNDDEYGDDESDDGIEIPAIN